MKRYRLEEHPSTILWTYTPTQDCPYLLYPEGSPSVTKEQSFMSIIITVDSLIPGSQAPLRLPKELPVSLSGAKSIHNFILLPSSKYIFLEPGGSKPTSKPVFHSLRFHPHGKLIHNVTHLYILPFKTLQSYCHYEGITSSRSWNPKGFLCVLFDS